MVTVFMEDLHGGFLNWTRGPGTSVILAETCQLVLFDPTLLSCAKKRRVEPPGRNCFFAKQESSILLGGLPRFLSTLSFWPVAAYRFDQPTTIRLPSSRFGSPSPPQGIFALQKSLRGDCGGDGVPAAVGNSSARAKKFPEEICFAPSRVCQVCRTPDD